MLFVFWHLLYPHLCRVMFDMAAGFAHGGHRLVSEVD